MKIIGFLLFLSCAGGAFAASNLPVEAPGGWSSAAPRAEISPAFAFDGTAGRDSQGSFIITSDERDALAGRWRRIFPVVGGTSYQFEAFHREQNVAHPRRSVFARILWRDARGRAVDQDGPAITKYLPTWNGTGAATAEAEHPMEDGVDPAGWNRAAGIYRAPAKATQAVVELHLQWAPNARVEWSQVSLRAVTAPPERKVRLAAVHFRPEDGKNALDNLRMFIPSIEEAARGKADLVVLGEQINAMGLGSFQKVAETVPGPCSDFLGTLAAQHNLYIVAGLIEREGTRIYGTSVLIGPDGIIVGKYRKTTLTASEITAGITPGKDYPVFSTRFGKVGMMICYDVFFPEAAQRLAQNGAEIIALPVYGCNQLLAAARACENQVYLVSSTYEPATLSWGVSGIFDYEGNLIAQAKENGSVAITEVDLNRRVYWTSIGDMKSALPRHRAVVEEGPPTVRQSAIARDLPVPAKTQ